MNESMGGPEAELRKAIQSALCEYILAKTVHEKGEIPALIRKACRILTDEHFKLIGLAGMMREDDLL